MDPRRSTRSHIPRLSSARRARIFRVSLTGRSNRSRIARASAHIAHKSLLHRSRILRNISAHRSPIVRISLPVSRAYRQYVVRIARASLTYRPRIARRSSAYRQRIARRSATHNLNRSSIAFAMRICFHARRLDFVDRRAPLTSRRS